MSINTNGHDNDTRLHTNLQEPCYRRKNCMMPL